MSETIDGMTVVLVVGQAVREEADGTLSARMGTPIVAHDYDAACVAVAAARRAADNENITTRIKHQEGFVGRGGVIMVSCDRYYVVVESLIRRQLKQLSTAPVPSEAVTTPMLVPCRDNHADQEWHADV